MDSLLEAQPALARALGDGTDATVVQEAVAVEHDLSDPLLEAPACREETDLLRRRHIGGLLQLTPELGRQRRDGDHRLARRIDDHLSIDVPIAPEDGQTRALLGSADALSDAIAAAHACDSAGVGAHQRVAPAAALPAFRRMRSSAYLT